MSRSHSEYQKQLTNFFNFHNVNHSNLSVELLKKSKKLILDTEKYSNYSLFYNKLTMIHSFKLPGIKDYPIRTNKEIIPIKEYNKMIYNTNLLKEKIKKRKVNFTMKTSNSNLMIRTLKTDSTINAKSFLIYIDQFNNMDWAIHKYITYKEIYFVDKNKDGNKKLLEQYVNNYYYNEIKLNLLEDNAIYKKENIFTIKNIEVKLKCNPLVLTFFDENGNKNTKIKFPFNCLPFFYGINFENFKLFFYSVIDFNYKKNIFKLNQIKFNNVFNSTLANNKLYDKDCLLLNYNKIPNFDFDWIINKDNIIKKFQLKIIMPKIKVRFKYLNNTKTSIIKSLDTTHMSYLVLEKFKDWDLFLLNSFCIIKEFRKRINQSLCYNPIMNNKNIKLDLDEQNLKLNKLKENQFSFIFFMTLFDELGGKNYYFQINCPKIQINYVIDGIKPYEKIFDLKIKEAIQLNKMRKSFWPEDMINRCLVIEEKQTKEKNWIESKLELDNKIFDFDNDLLKYIQRRDKFLSEIISKKSILKINLLFPIIIWFNSINLTEKIYNLKRNEFEELFDIPLNNWHEYIINNYKKIHDNSKVNLKDRDEIKKNTVLKSDKIRRKTRKKSVKNPFIPLTITRDN